VFASGADDADDTDAGAKTNTDRGLPSDAGAVITKCPPVMGLIENTPAGAFSAVGAVMNRIPASGCTSIGLGFPTLCGG